MSRRKEQALSGGGGGGGVVAPIEHFDGGVAAVCDDVHLSIGKMGRPFTPLFAPINH